ncbi:MAG: DUF3313 family protein [Woeseiaceae bacterium]
MNTIYRASTTMLVLMVLASISACATKSVTVEGYETTVDVSGLERDDSEAPNIIYRRPGAPGLGEFNAFIIDPVKVFYDDPGMEELSPEQVGRITQHLFDGMIGELRDAGYTVGTKSEAGKLRISFTLSGLRAPSAGANVTAAVVPFAARVGEVTVEAVLRDGLTNELEAVAVTRARGSRFLNASPWSTWSDVEKFLDSWAKGFRASVDEAHGR